jgi:S1-C subfamily serine protease
VGIAFAIPSDEARPVVKELITRHRVDRGWIGVALADISEDGTDPGVGVADVVRGSPAAQAGVRPGDVILAIDGQPIYNTLGLIRIVASQPPGRTVRLRIYRQGRAFEVSVVVGRRPPLRED